ncbi:hypothetical protein JCM10207_008880 [Rhodosporidiobolus poonsookiae]
MDTANLITPLVVAFSLTNTVLVRKDSVKNEARCPAVRPFLSTFLEDLCTPTAEGKPRYRPCVYTTARAPSTLSMLAAVELIPSTKVPFATGASNSIPKDFDKIWQVVQLEGDEQLSAEQLGARRTILVDDDELAGIRQPHNHIVISPFALHTGDFDSARMAAAASTATAGNKPLNPLEPLSLSADHPMGQDAHLLSTINLVERLRLESNVASALRSGLLATVRAEAQRDALVLHGDGSEAATDRVLADKGRAVCERLGIEVRREWDGEWRIKLLERLGKMTPEMKEQEEKAKARIAAAAIQSFNSPRPVIQREQQAAAPAPAHAAYVAPSMRGEQSGSAPARAAYVPPHTRGAAAATPSAPRHSVSHKGTVGGWSRHEQALERDLEQESRRSRRLAAVEYDGDAYDQYDEDYAVEQAERKAAKRGGW